MSVLYKRRGQWSTRYQGVLFGLYGTLVLPFRREEHSQAIRQCAAILGLDHIRFHEGWIETYPRRTRGYFGSVADNFAAIGATLDATAPEGRYEEAEEHYLSFTRSGLTPLPGAIELLNDLKEVGLVTGLLSNCAPDVAKIWPARNPSRSVFG